MTRPLIVLIIFISCLTVFAPSILAQENKLSATGRVSDLRPTGYLWQEHVLDVGDSARVLLKENNTLTTSQQRLSTEIMLLEDSIRQISDDLQRLIGEPQQLQPLISVKQENIDGLKKKLNLLRNEVASVRQSKAILEQQLSVAVNEEKALEDQKRELLRHKAELQARADNGQSSLDQQRQTFLAQVEQYKEHIAEVQKRIIRPSGDPGLLMAEVNELRTVNNRLSSEVLTWQRKLENSKAAISLLKVKQENFMAKDHFAAPELIAKRKKELEDKIAGISGEIERISRESSGDIDLTKYAQLNNLNAEISRLHGENESLRIRITEANNRIDQLKGQNDKQEVLTLSKRKQSVLDGNLKLKNELESLKAAVVALEEKIEPLARERQSLLDESSGHEILLASQDGHINELSRRLLDARRELVAAKKAKGAASRADADPPWLQRQSETLIQRKMNLEKSMDLSKINKDKKESILLSKINDYQKEIDDLRGSATKSLDQAAGLNRDYKLFTEEISRIRMDNNSLTRQLIEMRKEANRVDQGQGERFIPSQLEKKFEQKRILEEKISSALRVLEQASAAVKDGSFSPAAKNVVLGNETLRENINQFQVDNHLLNAKVEDLRAIIASLNIQKAKIEAILKLMQP